MVQSYIYGRRKHSMDLHFDYISLIDLLAAVQGSLLGLLLISQFRKHISFLLLGLFVFG